MNEQLLSIGSVVTLEGAEKKLMVMGVFPTDGDSGKMYDYIGVPYPEGFLDAETMFLFMHKDIQTIEFIGFINAEHQGYRHQLFKALEEQGVIEKSKE